jgi:soluble P-type ATPase
MLEIDIPGYGRIEIDHLVSDFTGTLSRDGILLPGVADLFGKITKLLEIHVITFDTFGTAKHTLEGLHCSVTVLGGDRGAEQKRDYILDLGPDRVIAIGNGANDRLMLGTARIGIMVLEAEGGAGSALAAADIVVRDIASALELIVNPKRLIATLRL